MCQVSWDSGNCRYDCSSADLNPIGAISKNDLRRFLVWAADHLGYSELHRVEAAPPTAELEPIREGVAAQVESALLVHTVGKDMVHHALLPHADSMRQASMLTGEEEAMYSGPVHILQTRLITEQLLGAQT